MKENVVNIGKLLSANVVAQVIGILVYPLLTRLYGAEDFGLLNLFLSIGGILSLLSTGEYGSAILLPQRTSESAGVVRVGLRVLGVWLLFIALSIPFSAPIANLFGAPELSCYWWLLVPYVGALGSWTLYNAWLTRHRQFGRVSGYQLNQSTTGVLTKLLFGWLGWLRSGLIVSSVVSPLIALVTSIGLSRGLFRGLWVHSEESLWRLAKRYRRFPLFSMPRALLNNLSGNLPALILTPYFGLTEMGFFAMAMTLSFRPITMITSSIHQVLFERVAQSVREGENVWLWLKKRWLQMAAVVVPLMIGLAVIMPWLVGRFLGSGWSETAVLIRYMMPWLTCVFLIAPLAFLSEVFGRQRLFLIIEIIYFVLRVLSMIIGIWIDSFSWAIILMSISGTVVLLTQLVLYIYFLRRYELSRLTQTGE